MVSFVCEFHFYECVVVVCLSIPHIYVFHGNHVAFITGVIDQVVVDVHLISVKYIQSVSGSNQQLMPPKDAYAWLPFLHITAVERENKPRSTWVEFHESTAVRAYTVLIRKAQNNKKESNIKSVRQERDVEG